MVGFEISVFLKCQISEFCNRSIHFTKDGCRCDMLLVKVKSFMKGVGVELKVNMHSCSTWMTMHNVNRIKFYFCILQIDYFYNYSSILSFTVIVGIDMLHTT